MAFDINKHIKTIKNNKKLLVPIGALVVLFAYYTLGDFFKRSAVVNKNPSGSIAIEEKYYNENEIERANSKITDNSEEQRKLLIEEEIEFEEKANAENGSYIKKTILNDDRGTDLKIKGINDNSLNSLNSLNGETSLKPGCKEDLISKVIICVEADGTSSFDINGAKVPVNENICKTLPYSSTDECADLLNDLDKKKRELEAKLLLDLEKDQINVRKGGGVASGNNNANVPPINEPFGSDKNKKSYKKNAMLLGLVSNDSIIASKGTAYSGVSDLLDRKKERDLLNEFKEKDEEETSLFVKPGSSYIGTLINPLNSLYSQVKPIINIEGGDLDGYRIVGEITTNEASGGLIITGNKLVSPTGIEKQVNSVAIRYTEDELTPLFVDKIDRHLMGKIGYTVLGALANDYSSQLSGNNSKDNGTINLGDTTASETGSQLSSTFNDIARQYKTEIKVNPQTMIVIFY